MANTPDGVYGRRPWNSNVPDWSYSRPWSSNEERLTQMALDAAVIPGQELQENIRPNLNIEAFPPRFGYRTRQLGIDDIIDVGRMYAEPRSTFSGGVAGYEGTSRNAQGGNSW